MNLAPVSGVSRNPLIGMRPGEMQQVPMGVPISNLAPVAGGLLVCRVNGEWLLRECWESLTREGDLIEWYDVPQDRDSLRSILQIVVTVVSIWNPLGWSGLALAAFNVGANIAINALLPPTAATLQGGPGETGENFATNLGGNQARLDQPIWKVCGRREINPPFACQPYFQYLPRVGATDPNLDCEQYFYAVFAIGVGNHDVVAKISNTPISRFADVLVANYLPPGTLPTTVLANVTTAGEVTSQVLDSFVYVGGFAACAPQRTCSSIGIDVIATRGLGKTGALSVTWRVEYRRINDFGQVLSAWLVLATETRTAFTSTPQRWSTRYTLTTAARVEVRIIRTDEQDTDPSALHEIAWTGLRAYLAEPAPLNEHTAHFEVVMRASSQLSNGSSRDFRLITEAYARTWDPDDGWQDEVHTRNPAWWMIELITSETWGLGEPDDRVDLDSFYALAQTNDARQDRFDWVFDSTMPSWDALQLIARTCRSRVFRRNGVISVARDELADIGVTAFTPRNSTNMRIVESLPTSNSPDGFIIEYQDHRTWEWTPIDCPCPGVVSMTNPVIKRIEGIVGATQAEREGLYEAANLTYRPRSVEWRTEMQGMLPAFMSPVKWQAEIPGYGQSGDVAFWDEPTLVMSLTEPPDWSAGSLFLTLIRDDGTLTTPVSVSPGPTEWDVVLPEAPDFELILHDGTRERPKYMLGPVGSDDLVKVSAIRDGGLEDGAQMFDMSGVIDDERVHHIDEHLLPSPGEIQDPVGDPDDADDAGPPVQVPNLLDRRLVGDGPVGVPTVSVRYSLLSDGRLECYAEGTRGFVTPPEDIFDGTDPTTLIIRDEWLLASPLETTYTALYEKRATLLSPEPTYPSNPVSGSPLGVWLPGDETAFWQMTETLPNLTIVELLVEIREISTGLIQASARITLWTLLFGSGDGGP